MDVDTLDLFDENREMPISLSPKNTCRPCKEKQDEDDVVGNHGQARFDIGYDTADKTQDKTPDNKHTG